MANKLQTLAKGKARKMFSGIDTAKLNKLEWGRKFLENSGDTQFKGNLPIVIYTINSTITEYSVQNTAANLPVKLSRPYVPIEKFRTDGVWHVRCSLCQAYFVKSQPPAAEQPAAEDVKMEDVEVADVQNSLENRVKALEEIVQATLAENAHLKCASIKRL